MEIKLIDAGNHKFASEFMSELPHNAILNKVAVGAGVTTVALKSKHKTVVCVPFISLIINKLDYCSKNNIDAIGVYSGGADVQDCFDFQGNIILTTWDSLPKVVQWLSPDEWHLVVDECHKLIDSAAFRTEAILGVLDNFKKFKSYCFVTATPVDDEFQLNTLKDLQKYQIKWNNLEPVNIAYYPVIGQDIYKTVAIVAMNFIKTVQLNAHFFINSVKGIAEIVGYLKQAEVATPDNIRIVTANNKQNADFLKSKLGVKYKIEPNTTQAKRINFYTSTSFEGSDLFDVNGVTFVVTDGSHDHTKINILTTLPQIAGRIRDSHFRNSVSLFYSPNTYFSHTTEEEFKANVISNLEEHKKVVNDYNNASTKTKELLKKGSADNIYLTEYNGDLVLNEAVLKNEMFNYRTIHRTYYIAKDEVYESGVKVNNGIQYKFTPNLTEIPKIEGLNKLQLNEKPNFQLVCKEYIELRNGLFPIGVDVIEQEYPLIKQAYEVLGADRMKALKFREKDLKAELIKVDKLKTNKAKVANLLNYKVGEFISLEQVKADLQQAYLTLEIEIKANSQQLSKFYDIQSYRAKGVKGFKIIGLRYR